MKRYLHHVWNHDRIFAVFMLVTLLLISGFLVDQQEQRVMQGGGWRKIDIKAVMDKIDRGDLVKHDAMWSRSVSD